MTIREKNEIILKMIVAFTILLLFIILNIITPAAKAPIRFEFNGTELVSNFDTTEEETEEEFLLKVKNNKKSSNELRCLALNMYHEARGQGKIGMLLVGHVTMNRVKHKNYPNTICKVVYQHKQFSWVHTIKDHTPKEKKSWKLAQDLAKQVINRTFDRSNGALFFHNKNISPYWSKDNDEIQKLDKHRSHIFYAFNG